MATRTALEQLKIDAAKKLEADVNKRIVALLKKENGDMYTRLEAKAIEDMNTPKSRKTSAQKKVEDAAPAEYANGGYTA